ncbi:hypothetical protein PENSPDRAFT_64345 [Peniophora sp. CONT]|nr:hypothetical protein PENSPDRAFT_64345 [Peniophora sp. CONT]
MAPKAKDTGSRKVDAMFAAASGDVGSGGLRSAGFVSSSAEPASKGEMTKDKAKAGSLYGFFGHSKGLSASTSLQLASKSSNTTAKPAPKGKNEGIRDSVGALYRDIKGCFASHADPSTPKRSTGDQRTCH